MKKHEVIINMINDLLAFWPSYCTYIRAISLIILSSTSLLTKIAVIKKKTTITPQKIIKRGLKQDMTDFLQISNKLFSKKRRQINKSKRKASIGKTNSRKATINNLDKPDKIELPIPLAATKISEPKVKDINIAMQLVI